MATELSNFLKVKEFVRAKMTGLINGEVPDPKVRQHSLVAYENVLREIERLEKESPSVEQKVDETLLKMVKEVKEGYKTIHTLVEEGMKGVMDATRLDEAKT